MGMGSGVVVVLGTGGTIAGTSSTGLDRDYQAAQLGVAQLVTAVPELGAVPLEAHQVAQVDSKDMSWPVWRNLLQACVQALSRPEVAGVVITHGTDTLEETALLLHLLLPPGKPVVLTAAMRPATSAQADGPGNLLGAVRAVLQASQAGEHGVVAVMAGRLWPALWVRKAHAWQVDAFDGGGSPPLMTWSASGSEQWSASQQPWPVAQDGLALRPGLLAAGALPWVALLVSHADADGRMVNALLAQSEWPQGWVVACTGHGTCHEDLYQALLKAEQGGALVWRSTRVARGGVSQKSSPSEPVTGALTPAQARLVMALGLALGGAPQAEAWRVHLVVQAQQAGLLLA